MKNTSANNYFLGGWIVEPSLLPVDIGSLLKDTKFASIMPSTPGNNIINDMPRNKYLNE